MPPSSRRLAWLVGLAAATSRIVAAAAADDPFATLVRPTEPLAPEAERAQLRAPPGFRVELFAAEPQINKPINLAFDARGRVWVSSTVEYPFAAERDRWVDAEGSRVRGSRDAIKILEDVDGDGRADKVTDFADGLNIPIGVLPWGRGCIAWSVPNIWYFEDADGDDRCDRRSVLFGPLGYERDVHGNIASLRLGPDGWVYATHGFNNESRFEVRPERLAGRKLGDPGTALTLHSGNTFRFRPDGSSVELWSRGQVNPFGMCFDRRGEMFTADCHSDPITQILRGACYPSFGKPHDGLGFAPVTCAHRHGSTGLCGVEIIEGGVWGPEWDGRILVGNCVTSRVNHDRLRYVGATARAEEQPDFLTSGDPWFRPVDLRLGPDGALYVADFYNRIIGHYEVDRKHPGRDRERGRIWRIVRTADGGARPAAPLTDEEREARRWRWTEAAQASWSDGRYAAALELLDDPTADARLRRQAAEAVAVHPRVASIDRLWHALTTAPADDPALRQSLRIAMRNHLQLPGALDAWRRSDVSAAADAEAVLLLRALDTADAAVLLLDRLEARSDWPAEPLPTLTMLARRLPGGDQAALVAYVARRTPADETAVVERLKALNEGFAARGAKPPPELIDLATRIADERLAGAERAADDAAVTIAARLVREFRLESLRPRVAAQWDRTGLGEDARLAVAEALADDAQRNRAVVALLKTSPWRVQLRLAEALAGSPAGAAALVEAAPPRLLTMPGVAQKLAAVADDDLKRRIAALTANLPSPAKELEPVLAAVRSAYESRKKAASLDVAAGRTVFVKHCAACHQLGGVGTQIGPQLEGLKARGPERLCEDILDPNRAVDPAFRRHVFTLDDGTVVAGLVRRDDGAALVVVDPQGKERVLVKDRIEAREESGLSLMPVGYDKLLSEAELCDLLAWLAEPR